MIAELQHLYSAAMAALPPELATLTPTDWIQFGGIAIVSWLGGHAVTRGDMRR